MLIGLYVIAIQLLTPHLDYAPTFEGCIMSFDGFPLEESGDNSIVSYIVCLFLKLKVVFDMECITIYKKVEF